MRNTEYSLFLKLVPPQMEIMEKPRKGDCHAIANSAVLESRTRRAARRVGSGYQSRWTHCASRSGGRKADAPSFRKGGGVRAAAAWASCRPIPGQDRIRNVRCTGHDR